MASRQPNFYKLKRGAVFSDLFPMDFIDLFWQAFEKDQLKSVTLEISGPTERMGVRVVDVKKKARGP
jgi:hypothetical protein